MNDSHLWFFRRDGEMRGPFPIKLIHDFVILGRLGLDDEVSGDGRQWGRLKEHPELVPPEAYLDLANPQARTRWELARRRADERGAPAEVSEGVEQRSFPQDIPRVQGRRRNLAADRRATGWRWLRIVALLVVVFVALLMAAWHFQAPFLVDVPSIPR